MSIWFVLIVIVIFTSMTYSSDQCIKSKFGTSCVTNTDCRLFNEQHLICNRTNNVNICAFTYDTYISTAQNNKHCPGIEYSAESWSNPVSNDELKLERGVDCMRLCWSTETCFGIVVLQGKCYLRNEKCFSNLITYYGGVVGILSVVREDYHCGCHYEFIRRESTGEILSWIPSCPSASTGLSPYACCSTKGLCIQCPSNSASSLGLYVDSNDSNVQHRIQRSEPILSGATLNNDHILDFILLLIWTVMM